MPRKEYSKQFKEEAVKLSYEIGGAQAARKLDIAPNILYRWPQKPRQMVQKLFAVKGK